MAFGSFIFYTTSKLTTNQQVTEDEAVDEAVVVIEVDEEDSEDEEVDEVDSVVVTEEVEVDLPVEVVIEEDEVVVSFISDIYVGHR